MPLWPWLVDLEIYYLRSCFCQLLQCSCQSGLSAHQVETTCPAMFSLKGMWAILVSFLNIKHSSKRTSDPRSSLRKMRANINSEIPWDLIFMCGVVQETFCILYFCLQCDENSTFNNHALYLGLPCCKEDYSGCPNIPSSLIFQRSTKESFFISTQLSSTKLTQNGRWWCPPLSSVAGSTLLMYVKGDRIYCFFMPQWEDSFH